MFLFSVLLLWFGCSVNIFNGGFFSSTTTMLVYGRSLTSQHEILPAGCKWQITPSRFVDGHRHQNNDDDDDDEEQQTDDVVGGGSEDDPQPDSFDSHPTTKQLTCHIRAINAIDAILNNVTQSLSERIVALKLVCSSTLFFENVLLRPSKSASPHSPIFTNLKHLKHLTMEYCKIRSIPPSSLSSLRHLHQLAIRSHNSDWSSMTLEFHSDSFRGLSDLRRLELADNNIWTTPPDLFCPLYSLLELNLTRNKLQDIVSLSLSDLHKRSCLANLEVLDLSNNDIIVLPDNGLSALVNLEELHLERNAISKVADRALIGLSSLRRLNMSSNCFVALPPELFQWSRDLQHLHLHNNSLSVLAPGLLENLDQLQILDLSRNELSSRWVNRDTFAGLVRLVVLNLAHNQLSRIDTNVFHDLYSLQILNLADNRIDFIADNAFAELRNLHALTLSRNLISRIEPSHLAGMYTLNQLLLDSNQIEFIHSETFENLTNLQDLGLNGNLLGGVPVGISKLRFLKTLDLGKNHIDAITNASFQGLDQLYGLRLVDNYIVNVSRDAFSTLPALQVLNLASNKIKFVEQSAFARNPTLKAIRLDQNQLTDISGVFTNLQSLLWLNVSSNQLMWFDFSHLPPSLEWLDMHDNQIPELGNYYDVRNSLKIKMLDVSFNLITEIQDASIPDSIEVLFLNNNNIHSILPKTFYHKSKLEKVVLYGNQIRYLDISALSLSVVPLERDLPQFFIAGNPFYCDCKMEWLLRINHLSNLRQYPQVLDLDTATCDVIHARGVPPHQQLLKLKPSQFLCPYQSHCFAVCHCCDFDACDCEMTCPTNCTCYHDHTWSSNVVDCSRAGYTTIPERIPMDATEIHLDGNDLGELDNHLFIGKKKLEVLYLNNSNVRSITNRTFNGLKSLKVLHMDNNRLKELAGREFEQMERLNQLYLDHNEITLVNNRTFRNLHHLQILTLDDNDIVNLDLQQITDQTPPRLTLDGNKWSCDCVSLARLRHQWMMTHKTRTLNMDKLKCVEFNDKSVLEAMAACGDLLTEMPTEPSSTEVMRSERGGLLGGHYVPVLAAILVAVIILCLCGAIVFVFRQDVRLWAHSKYGVRIFDDKPQTDLDSHQDSDPLYDCYMVYSQMDEDLVVRVIATELEAMGYTLCLHYRDLHLLGNASFLADAMMGATEASRRVVLILSPDLICSEWSRPEFRTALQIALHSSRRQKLICVLYGDPLEPMDPDLRTLLRACCVARWSERLFWDKIRLAMPNLSKKNDNRSGRKRAVGIDMGVAMGMPPQRYTPAPTCAPPPDPAWFKYAAATLTPTPTQSTYMSGADSTGTRSSTEDEGGSASTIHYGSTAVPTSGEANNALDPLNHSYVSIDSNGRPPQYEPPRLLPNSQQMGISSPPMHHVYSTIPEQQQTPISRTYFV